jgi:hypothetical protein
MTAKRTRKAKAAKMAKKHKSKQVSKKTYARIRLLAAAALVFCAVMAIVVDASDQSKARTVASASTRPASASSSTVAPAAGKPAAAASQAIPDSTYVGCLREDDGKFVLTEIGGPDVPKSRNWKTMFVTTKAGKLEVASAGTLRLSPHVDKTVQITGKRSDKMFAARSLKVIGATCN